MVWTLFMIAAIAAQMMGAVLLAKGYKVDDRSQGLTGTALTFVAPFLFYAAGAI